jgi:hypothetical protein
MGKSKETAPKRRRSVFHDRKWRPRATKMGTERMERLAAES